MREHGVLKRVLLVYGESVASYRFKANFSARKRWLTLRESFATLLRIIMRNLKEDFLFPHFEKANLLGRSGKSAARQHQAGRQGH